MPVSRLTAVMNMTASTKTGAILIAGGLIGKFAVNRYGNDQHFLDSLVWNAS